MIIYNVTVKVSHLRVEEWLKWMKEVHIPQLMKTGFFTDHQMCELLHVDDEEGKTFVIQYHMETKSDYNRYQELYASDLQAAAHEQFGEDALGFRTLMMKI